MWFIYPMILKEMRERVIHKGAEPGLKDEPAPTEQMTLDMGQRLYS